MSRTLYPFRFRSEGYYEENDEPITAQDIVDDLNKSLYQYKRYFDNDNYPKLPRVKLPLVDSLTGLPIPQPKIGWYAKWEGSVVVCDPKKEFKAIVVP